ncbi:ABC transporter permease [Lentzea tibetensis]|uniref:ABC transporter permease n=1 Tax=Lentzea tibetensis TaxID=2591470 RepID=A0A563EKU3_9PSEU|nr:ABC transporter permease [Lentzea tibetensis]TWP46874.1 ABC transporter permease [Lentzea tibetensis]
MGSYRAELLRLFKWPATWVLIGVWLVMTLTFGYVFNYVAFKSGDEAENGRSGAQLLAQMMPEMSAEAVLRGLPMFGGAIVIVLAALAVGSGYGWGTWKTTLTAGPRRLSAMGGTLAALASIVLLLVAATFVADFGASVLVATLEDQSWSFPSIGHLAEGLGASVLIAGMWAAMGVVLGVLTRGPALAVGLGLLWAVVVENLLRGVGALLGPVEDLTKVLPGGAAGNLAGAFGATGAPGVLTELSGTTASLLVAGYLSVFAVIACWTTMRRDLV